MKVIKLESEIKPLLYKAMEVKIAVAIMTDYGFELLKENLDVDCKVSLLIGIDLLTPVDLFKELLAHDNSNWKIKIFRKRAFFHPKLYIIKTDKKNAFIGSGNFTKGGVGDHVELFQKIEGKEVDEFESWFEQYFGIGDALNQQFIDDYEPLFIDASEVLFNATRRLQKLKRDLETGTKKKNFDLTNCNFSNQFFKFEDFNAFTGNKPYSVAAEVNEERMAVKERLFVLHDRIYPLIKNKAWDLHPHEQIDHLVSSHKHGAYTSEDLGALWLHYGRSPDDLRKFKNLYGDNQTSMYQMRIQILVHAFDISVWLRVGKNNGSIVDRQAFKENMKNMLYRKTFFDLLTRLPLPFYISINNEDRKVDSFQDEVELFEFTKGDDIRNAYFIIGRDYLPNDDAISDKKINETIIKDFTLLYPIYLHLRTTI